jgi:predicted metal-dependent hydrolase
VVRVTTRDLFEQGRRLFNAGRFFEAHEAWEEAWRAQSGTTRLLLQGLIQIAAGYHKAFVQGQPGGCARLLEAGLEKLRIAAPSPERGLGEFLRAVEEGLHEAGRWERGKAAGLAPAPRLNGPIPLDS